ncbi:MAG TPA: hypothetical protein PKJ15_07110, partial [Methanomassiliicoccales archaeon]|nr:hypothetical protein [Methanomassiliicoccales archaeon]
YPEKAFEGRTFRGDVGITNMSRPQRGLMGIRLEDSEEFGPTGEEAHGTSLLGRFVGDLDAMMAGINEGDIIYIRRATPEESVPRKEKKPAKKVNEPAAKKAKAPAKRSKPKED